MSPDLTLAALRRIDRDPPRLSSAFAYGLIEDGVLTVRHPRGKLKAQGAGFIGGRVLADLRRAGLIGGTRCRHALTAAGRRWLLAGGEPACPHCALPLTMIGEDYGVRVTAGGQDVRVHPSCVGRFAADHVRAVAQALGAGMDALREQGAAAPVANMGARR